MSRRADFFLTGALKASAALSACVVLLVVAFLGMESVSALRSIGILRFFTDPAWYPSEAQWGMAPMLWGSLLVTAGAVGLALPLGVLTAVFRRYYAPPAMAGAYRRLIELLAGIPSVVYGFWGLVVLVPIIARMAPPGPSLLAAALVLAIMILPTVALMADSAIGQVPARHVDGAYALGLSRPAVILTVVLPGARGGIATGAMLGTARAIGETMAVLMVCGGVVNIPSSIFDPVRTLTANMALEMSYAMEGHRSALFVSGLLLVAMVVTLVAAAHRVEGRSTYV